MQPVRLATSRTPAGRGTAARVAAPIEGAASLRFGDETVYFGAEDEWGRFKRSASRAGLTLRERPAPVDAARLHVVIQKGRLFQQEHPEVPVLLDKGRFLLVDIDPAQADVLGDSDVPCFSIRRAEALEAVGADARSRVVFDTPAWAAPRARAAHIKPVVERISRATFEADLVRLVEFPTRLSTSSSYVAACDFATERLSALGYETFRQEILVRSEPSQNIVARREGAGGSARGLVVVGAHLDSINHQGGPSSSAPGADDDGTGSAGVLEIARALKGYAGVHDLQLVLFGGEEQGLFGSKQFVASLNATNRARMRAVVNMDMIGSLNTANPTVLLEGAPVSQSVMEGLASAAATYTGLAVQTSLNPFNSDHVSFIRKGMPAVLTIEGADDANDAIHSARDTLDRINFDLALDTLRMNAAYVAEALA